VPPRAATLYEAERPNLRIERAERPDIGGSVGACAKTAEPSETSLRLLDAAKTLKGQRHDTVTSLLTVLVYHLIVNARPSTLRTASRHAKPMVAA
jgi:hypothetical protein